MLIFGQILYYFHLFFCEKIEHGSIPISIASSMINSVVGHEIISRPGFESLVRHGVYTLYRLRALTDAKWKRLLFSEKERDLIRDCIKAG